MPSEKFRLIVLFVFGLALGCEDPAKCNHKGLLEFNWCLDTVDGGEPNWQMYPGINVPSEATYYEILNFDTFNINIMETHEVRFGYEDTDDDTEEDIYGIIEPPRVCKENAIPLELSCLKED